MREIASYEGLFTSPTLLSTDVSVPQRDGELPGTARLSPGGFTLSMWLAGASRREAESNWEQLLAFLVRRDRLVMFERRRPDGTHRQCFGRVVGRIAPTPIGRLGMRAQVEVSIPSGTWQNTGPEPDTGPMKLQPPGVSGPLDRLVECLPMAGATAPFTRLWVQVTGPVEGLTIQCDETGAWATYDLPLAAGQALTIDGGGDIVGAPRVDAFRYKGPYMVEMIPRPGLPALPPRLRVRATQAGAEATVQVRGRRLYLTM